MTNCFSLFCGLLLVFCTAWWLCSDFSEERPASILRVTELLQVIMSVIWDYIRREDGLGLFRTCGSYVSQERASFRASPVGTVEVKWTVTVVWSVPAVEAQWAWFFVWMGNQWNWLHCGYWRNYFLPYDRQHFMSLESAFGFLYWTSSLRLSYIIVTVLPPRLRPKLLHIN
jgi:hypothetical protein